MVLADVRNPGKVLADPGLAGLIDPREPCCVVLGAVLHYLPARRAREVAAGLCPARRAGQPDRDHDAPLRRR